MSKQLFLIKAIHFAFTLGLILAYIIIGSLSMSNFLIIPEITTATLPYLLLPIVAIFLSGFIFKRFVSKTKANLTLDQKVVHYQTAVIMRYGIIEGAAFLIIFMFPNYILLGILLIVYLIFTRPTEAEFKRVFQNN